MRLVIACSKNWFRLDQSIRKSNEILSVCDPSELTEAKVREFDPNYIFFPHWNWIVGKELFNNFECVVFHTAPLPYGRGGSPIQNLIIEGFTDSPVCALKMTEKIDGGPIYSQKVVSLSGDLSQIFERIGKSINELIKEIIRDSPTPVEQIGEVRNFKRRTGTDNLIPTDLTLEQMYDRIRMLDAEGYPLSYFEVGDNQIEFSSATLEAHYIVAKCRIKKCT